VDLWVFFQKLIRLRIKGFRAVMHPRSPGVCHNEYVSSFLSLQEEIYHRVIEPGQGLLVAGLELRDEARLVEGEQR
jgi:hypothetical protein